MVGEIRHPEDERPMRTWMIGSGEDCDVVVAQPRVSRRHCRLTETPDGYRLEDLGSSNGTYVNRTRIAGPMIVTPGDRITLGALEPMPWPPASGEAGATVLRIGRVPDNDIVLDDPRVSSHHARLLVSGDRTLIEDLGSSNGTFVNSPERRVTQAVPLTEADTIYFGSLAVPAKKLLVARTVPERVAPAPPPIPVPETPPEPLTVPPRAAVATVTPWTIAVLVQAPVLAVLILLVCGRQAATPLTEASRPMVADGMASTAYALALSAVWLGGTLAVWAALAGRSRPGRVDSLEARILGSPVSRFSILGVLCVAECAVLLAIVHPGSALKGPWITMFGVLILTASVALSLGLVVFSLVRDPRIAVAVLMVAFVAMMVMGGRFRALTASGPGARVAALMPSRWAFEGLLLLESESHEPPKVAEEADRVEDLAEDFFRSDTERMGPKADAMALGFMLIGLAAAAGFISSGSKPWR
jgi:pSer/pThr/pTyr-binding forkhead associated (FHA) protein